MPYDANTTLASSDFARGDQRAGMPCISVSSSGARDSDRKDAKVVLGSR